MPGSAHEGLYVGQSSRTLYERACEHMNGLKNLDTANFLFKHWATAHSEMLTSPEFQFKVVKCHKSPLDRMLHEAVRIIDKATMNSRSESDGYKIPRIKIEPNKTITYQTKIEGRKIILVENKFLWKKSFLEGSIR